ncbi:MAG: HlyD family efflux transporter periplasmic adaptor subunit [Candidatus Eremiobacteraeota bacterium]|nr:HlyD family efflux transporter periplasmic adaptor subunit [Candidatus Eremiobacteraeota bacterium]
MRSNRARLWAVVAGVALIAIIFFVLRHRATQAPAVAAPAVKSTVAKDGTFLLRVAAHGRVGPPPGSTAALAFPVAGRIASIDVRVGDRVSAGQTLAQLDPTPFELAVSQARGDAQSAAGTYSGSGPAAVQSAQAKLAVARANLQRAEHGTGTAQSDRVTATSAARQADLKVQADQQTLARVQTLFSAGISAAKDVQAARTQLEADRADARAAHARASTAQAGVSGSLGQARADYAQAQTDLLVAQGAAMRAQASLAEAQRNLANATLRAPSDGIVVAVLKHPGESADPTMPVVQLGASYVHAATLSVSAAQARDIKAGDPAELRVPRSTRVYGGRVIAAVPAVDPATQQATVVVNGIPPDAVAGDSIDASIITGRRRGIIVPTTAVVQDPQSGDTLVFVAGTKDGTQQFSPRTVRVGAGDQTTTLIESGLRAGEVIAAEGAFDLLAPAAGG